MPKVSQTAVIGAGTIGASWAALFLASGRSVAVFDPAAEAEASVRAYVERSWPTLTELDLTGLDLTGRGDPGALTFHASAAEAVAGAGFVQENVPERLPLKHAVFAEIEPALAPGAVVASSASGLTLAEMQEGWRDPAPLILGHPFNPPHLVPLVEVMGNARTAPEAVPAAEAFYESVGRVTIRLNTGMPGHVANRLQAAMWREAIHLVVEGVASVEDLDKAVWAGPGLRWAAMGPTMLFHLGAGEYGLPAFCEHFRDTFHGWWEDLGQVRLDADVIRTLAEGVVAEAAGRSPAELSAHRDALLVALLSSTRELR